MRSYGCTFGCGNPYDYVVTAVSDATTEFLCTPCFVRIASDMVAAITDPSDPAVREAAAWMATQDMQQAPGPSGKPGRKNAPVGTSVPSVIDDYDSVIEDIDAGDE